jgi:hypothetical protein
VCVWVCARQRRLDHQQQHTRAAHAHLAGAVALHAAQQAAALGAEVVLIIPAGQGAGGAGERASAGAANARVTPQLLSTAAVGWGDG